MGRLLVFLLGSTMLGWMVEPRAKAQEPPPRYFPLDAGNAWTFGESAIRYEILVLAREGDMALVRYHPLIIISGSGDTYYRVQPYDLVLRERGLEIDVLRDDKWLPFYRFGEETFIHYDHGSCEDGATLGVTPYERPVETAAGVFTDCLFIGYRTPCADGGREYDILCPGVGPVRIAEDNIAGGAIWELLAFDPAPKNFIRGDANADGDVNLSDAFAILNTLFLYGQLYFVPCDDAADMNDDGDVNISDAIFALSFLFGGGRQIPGPGPVECGPDPTEEDLHCGSFYPCCVEPFCVSR